MRRDQQLLDCIGSSSLKTTGTGPTTGAAVAAAVASGSSHENPFWIPTSKIF